MPMTSNTIEALWGFVNKPRIKQYWARWGILADCYDEEGDEVADQFCRWICKTKLKPDTKERRAGKQAFDWWFECKGYTTKNGGVPTDLGYAIKETNSNEWLGGSTTRRRAYEFLLEAWRQLTDEQRQEYWNWNP